MPLVVKRKTSLTIRHRLTPASTCSTTTRTLEKIRLQHFSPTVSSWCSPGSTLKKKKGRTSDQCGAHHHTMGGLAYAKTQGLGPTVPQPGLFLLSADAPRQR